MRTTGRSAALAACLLTLAALASAQTVYNPTLVEFGSPDHAIVTGYRLDVMVDGGTVPALSVVVPAADVVVVAGPRYQIPLRVLPTLPAGHSYRFRVSAIGEIGTSDPSDLAPETARISPCVTGVGVQPMTITLGALPPLVVGAIALVPLTITAPQPVFSVTVDLASDGQPAWLFQSADDRRGAHLYAVGPFKQPGSSLLTLTAVDAAGCGTSVTPQLVTVGR